MFKKIMLVSLLVTAALTASDQKTKSEAKHELAQQQNKSESRVNQPTYAATSQPQETLTLESLGFLSLTDASALPAFGKLYDEAFADGVSFAQQLHKYEIYLLKKENKFIGFMAFDHKEQNGSHRLYRIAVTQKERRKGYGSLMLNNQKWPIFSTVVQTGMGEKLLIKNGFKKSAIGFSRL